MIEANSFSWMNTINDNHANRNMYHGHISEVMLKFDLSITELQIS